MEKIMSFLLTSMLFINAAFVNFNSNIYCQDVSDILAINYSDSKDIFYLKESAVENTDYDTLNNFMDEGGIIIVEHDATNIVAENLGMTLSMVSETGMDTEIEEVNNTTEDIVTLYYECENNVKGTYVISVGNSGQDNVEALIEEAITSIRKRQAENVSVSATAISPSDYTAVPLGILDRTESLAPKGKLNISYTLFSVEDYSSRDFYIMRAKCNGMPGSVLYKDEKYGGNYEEKYQGEYMEFTVSTDTSSVTVDAYDPHSTIGSASYSVNLVGTMNFKDLQIKGGSGSVGFAYSRNINHINITANAITKSVDWELSIKKNAQKNTVSFEPAVAFDCPTGKASIVFDVSCVYSVDSWNTFSEDIVSNKSILCTISSATFKN